MFISIRKIGRSTDKLTAPSGKGWVPYLLGEAEKKTDASYANLEREDERRMLQSMRSASQTSNFLHK
jgi:hypothetical protein